MKMEKVFYSSLLNAEWETYDDYISLVDTIVKEFKPFKITLEICEHNEISWTIWLTFEREHEKPLERYTVLDLNLYYDYAYIPEIKKKIYIMRDELKRIYKDIKISTNLRGW